LRGDGTFEHRIVIGICRDNLQESGDYNDFLKRRGSRL
jgi:hypothetical protein